MSFSEYNGSKAKVSQTVGRILRSAQGNLPKIQGSQVTALLKSLSSPSNNATEQLHRSHSSPPQPSSRFGLQKIRLPGLDRKRNQHAELLEHQDGVDDGESDDEMESHAQLSHTALIGPSSTSPSQKSKRWPF